jgi:hypothetical protein
MSTEISWRRDAAFLRDALDALLSDGAPGSVMPRRWPGKPGLEMTPELVAAVGHLVRRAHEALHEGGESTEVQQRRCAEVLFTGLPDAIGQRLILADTIRQVKFLAREYDASRAVPLATAALLGWKDAADTALILAVRAIAERRGEAP